MQYVIIGNSTAATFAVEGIRAVDKEGSITVISDETRPAYGRPLISYYLYGRIKLENTDYRSASFYTDNGVTVKYGVRAEKIDPEKKNVALSDGSTIGYDKLLVATGSSPLVPPAEGLDTVPYHTFMTMDSALALEKELSPEKRVLVVGAGLIGLKCVEGILDRVGSVTVVDLAARILPSILDEEGSAIVQERLEACGVNFVLGDCAVRYAPGLATLRSGKEVPFDILVIAAGVRPNVSLVREAGGEVNRGIVVNDRQETTIPDVYAAGDNCESYDICSGTRRILALLPNAAFQGETAGSVFWRCCPMPPSRARRRAGTWRAETRRSTKPRPSTRSGCSIPTLRRRASTRAKRTPISRRATRSCSSKITSWSALFSLTASGAPIF